MTLLATTPLATLSPAAISLGDFVPTVVALPVLVVILWGARKWTERAALRDSRMRLRGQITMLALSVFALIAIILALPIEGEQRNELLSLLGIVLSAAIALASTTFLGNILAGLMVRALGNLRPGDFLRIDGHFGRVTERGLFHTEIQTEDRDLTTIPNLVLATRPMTVLRGSGTILSASVSLGYDVPHDRVRELLTNAANAAGLEEPFVRIVSLGDFTVEYRVGGLLTEVKELLTRRTALRREMLDALHGGGVEIASPAILATRAHAPSTRFVPGDAPAQTVRGVPMPAEGIESLAFDKADMAESVESLQDEIRALHEEHEELVKRRRESADEDIRQALADEISRMELRATRLEHVLEVRRGELENPRS